MMNSKCIIEKYILIHLLNCVNCSLSDSEHSRLTSNAKKQT